MGVQEIKSRLFYLEGNGVITVAYSTDSDTPPISVKDCRCLYRVRLELAPAGHPEINEDMFELFVLTTKWGISYNRQTRSRVGREVPFEELVEKAKFPNSRVNNQVDSDISDALAGILRGHHYNCDVNLYSEFDGHWDAFSNRFDERRTYLPIIRRAVEEVVQLL